MKLIPLCLIITSLAAAGNLRAAEPTTDTATNAPAAEQAAPNPAAQPATPAEPIADAPAPPPPPPPDNMAAVSTDTNTSAGLRLNFRNAPLNLVLEYFSDAAGFIINKETEVRGTVDVWSKDCVTKEEAVALLNSVLRKNGYGVSLNGRILTIVGNENWKTDPNLPVEVTKMPYDADSMPKSDEIVTQIIPVRYASASQLMNNLQILLPTSATLSVNESANSLILVASKTDIRRILKIVNALDTSIASVSSIHVFPLKYADAKQLASVIQQLFTTTGMGNQGGPGGFRGQLFNMFRGGGMGGPGGPGGQGGSSGTGSKVTAAADDYSNSLIVCASAELMTTITDMVQQIDQPASDVTELRVFHLLNADPTEVADQIAQLFPDDTRSGSGSDQSQGRFRFFGSRRGNQSASTTSDRMKKKTRVLAVPDPRTSSLLISAASELMPQLADMIEKLDSSADKKEIVTVVDLKNADPQDVTQVLEDLFNRNNTGRRQSSANNSRSMLGTGNPLTQRQTTSQYNNSGLNTSFGSSRGGSSSFGSSGF